MVFGTIAAMHVVVRLELPLAKIEGQSEHGQE